MALNNIGAAVHEKTAGAMLSAIQYADQVGVPAIWLTTGVVGQDFDGDIGIAHRHNAGLLHT